MMLIEEIVYYQVISGELKYKGKARIRQELIRPLLEFKNSKGISLKLGWGNDNFKCKSMELRVNPYSKWSIYFTEKELLYLSTKYNFSMVLKKGYDDIYHGLLSDVNEKYDTCGTLIYLEQDNATYIAIIFKRW